MPRLKSVLHITNQLNDLLDETTTVNNREEIIHQINELVEKRGHLLSQIKPPFTGEEKRMGHKIITLNIHIQAKMNDIFMDLKKEIKQINKQKKTSYTYENPYEAVQTIDGMFWDQKQ